MILTTLRDGSSLSINMVDGQDMLISIKSIRYKGRRYGWSNAYGTKPSTERLYFDINYGLSELEEVIKSL